MSNDIVLQKRIDHITRNIMKCDDYVIEELIITVDALKKKITETDINTVSIINQTDVEIDVTAREQISSEDNVITFSKSNFSQKANNQTFRGNLQIDHKSGTFMPYQLDIITIKPVGV